MINADTLFPTAKEKIVDEKPIKINPDKSVEFQTVTTNIETVPKEKAKTDIGKRISVVQATIDNYNNQIVVLQGKVTEENTLKDELQTVWGQL